MGGSSIPSLMNDEEGDEFKIAEPADRVQQGGGPASGKEAVDVLLLLQRD